MSRRRSPRGRTPSPTSCWRRPTPRARAERHVGLAQVLAQLVGVHILGRRAGEGNPLRADRDGLEVGRLLPLLVGAVPHLPVGDALGRDRLRHRLVPPAVLPELVALADVPRPARGVPHHHVRHAHHLVDAALGDDAELDAAVLAELVLQQVGRRRPVDDHARRRAHRDALDVGRLLPPPLRHRPHRPRVLDLVRRLRVALDLQPAARLPELLLLSHIPRRRSVRSEAEPEHVVGIIVLLVRRPPVQGAARARVLAKLVLPKGDERGRTQTRDKGGESERRKDQSRRLRWFSSCTAAILRRSPKCEHASAAHTPGEFAHHSLQEWNQRAGRQKIDARAVFALHICRHSPRAAPHASATSTVSQPEDAAVRHAGLGVREAEAVQSQGKSRTAASVGRYHNHRRFPTASAPPPRRLWEYFGKGHRAPDLALDLVLEPGKGAAIKKIMARSSRRLASWLCLPAATAAWLPHVPTARVVLAVAACTSPLSSCQQRCGRLLVLPLTATISCMRSATGEAARAGCSPANDLARR